MNINEATAQFASAVTTYKMLGDLDQTRPENNWRMMQQALGAIGPRMIFTPDEWRRILGIDAPERGRDH